MLLSPYTPGSVSKPAGYFFGDTHNDLVHLVQLTASISELQSHGVKVLFLEAFYAGGVVPSGVSALRDSMNSRSFNHFDPSVRGFTEHARCYHSLIQRCNRAGIAVEPLDQPRPSAVTGGAQTMLWRVSGGLNEAWRDTIMSRCSTKNWRKYAVFAGSDHSRPLTKAFAKKFCGLRPQVWNRASRNYQSLPSG